MKAGISDELPNPKSFPPGNDYKPQPKLTAAQRNRKAAADLERLLHALIVRQVTTLENITGLGPGRSTPRRAARARSEQGNRHGGA
jgi:hypothetical protein